MKLIISIFFSYSALALAIPPLNSPIVDQAGLLSTKLADALSRSLINLKRQTGTELALLTVNSLEGEPIENYSISVVDKWKLGQKDKDNGILFLISLKDRKMRIEVGQGLEGEIPDAMAGRIISAVRPYFKNSDYQGGIVFGLSKIVERLGHKLTNTPVTRRHKKKANPIGTLIFVVIFIFFSFFGRRRGGFFYVGSGFGSSGGSGFSGGGGFGSGGGFSGGGASGGW